MPFWRFKAHTSAFTTVPRIVTLYALIKMRKTCRVTLAAWIFRVSVNVMCITVKIQNTVSHKSFFLRRPFFYSSFYLLFWKVINLRQKDRALEMLKHKNGYCFSSCNLLKEIYYLIPLEIFQLTYQNRPTNSNRVAAVEWM